MARNFSEDGAVGAMTGGTPGTATGGFTSGSLTPSIMNNFNMTGTPADTGSTMPIGFGDGGGYGDGGGFGSDQGNPSVGAIPTGDTFGGGGGYGGGGFAPMGYGGGSSEAGSTSGSAFPAAPSWSFSQGGAIDEGMGGDPNATDPQGSAMGNRLQLQINAALSTVDNIMSYGRKLHGIGGEGGGQQQAMNTEGFTQSDNIEDRRDSDQTVANPKGMDRISQNVSNNSANIVDKAKSMFAPDPTKNKMSQDAGINDIGGDGSTAQAGAQQAIPTDEEEAQ